MAGTCLRYCAIVEYASAESFYEMMGGLTQGFLHIFDMSVKAFGKPLEVD